MRPGMTRLACLLLAISACAAESPDDEIVANAPPNAETVIGNYCPGVTGSGVTTYRGLLGNYRRATAPVSGEPTQIYFVPAHDDPDAAGWYASGFRAGTFRAIPDNPAIGAALALDTDGDGKLDQTFFVLGLARATTAITALCLVGAGHPFELDRTLY